MRWPYPSEITLAETDRVAGKHREIGGQLIFALAGLARALQEDALLVGAIGEAVGLGDGAADGEALRIGIFARLVHFAEHIDRAEARDLDRDFWLEQKAARQLRLDRLRQFAGLQTRRLDLADQREGDHADRKSTRLTS